MDHALLRQHHNVLAHPHPRVVHGGARFLDLEKRRNIEGVVLQAKHVQGVRIDPDRALDACRSTAAGVNRQAAIEPGYHKVPARRPAPLELFLAAPGELGVGVEENSFQM